MKVAVLALGFGGSLALSFAIQRWRNGLSPYLSLKETLFYTTAGLSFGIFVMFDWRAFHQPLIFLEVPLLLIFLVAIGMVKKPTPTSQKISSQYLGVLYCMKLALLCGPRT